MENLSIGQAVQKTPGAAKETGGLSRSIDDAL
jgi:hypothetical protein